jgi:DNA-binding PadR family transcriptional regulator
MGGRLRVLAHSFLAKLITNQPTTSCVYYYCGAGEMPPRTDTLGEFEQSVLLAILHRLQDGDDAYGVTVRETIESRTGRRVAVGALYTALDRLETKGYVRSRMSEPTPERGGRSRRHFVVTDAGLTALERSREYLARMWQGLPVRSR